MNRKVPPSRLSLSSLILVGCLCVSLSGCLRRTLVTGLSEREAQEVAVALYKGSLRANLIREPKARGQAEETWQVEIRGGDRSQIEAWRVLQENGLPRHREEGVEEVYRNGQLIPTAAEERARFLLATGGELARSLKSIPGVIDARVHVAVPDNTVLRDPSDKPHATASVLLKYWSSYPEPPADRVAKLVANGVEGLDEKNISVMSAKLRPPDPNQLDELRNLVAPTIGLAIDYAYLGGTILTVVFGAWVVFSIAPRLVRWIRTQAALLRESLVD